MRPIIQSRKQGKNGAKMFFIFALLLLTFFSVSPNSLRMVSSWVNMAAVPFWNTAGSTTDMLPLDGGGLFRSKTELARENALLKEKVGLLTRDLKGYDFAVQENIELKKLLIGKKNGGIFAGVLARPGGSLPFDVFLLDIGVRAGVKNGDIVLGDQNIALGKVTETYPYSSKVKGFTSAGEVTDAFLGPENIPVQLKGLGGGAYTVELPRDLDVREGDAAVFPGLEGFVLGYVESKEENLVDSFQKLYLRSPVNIFELKHAQIIPASSAEGE